MYKYFIKIPWIVKKLFPDYIWNIPTHEKAVYLTFDDGPHPQVTPWVLQQLKEYNALATFFCIGNYVKQYPDVFNQVLTDGHSTGNHTQHHLNGWQTSNTEYFKDISQASHFIKSNLFRPPYGKIKTKQAKNIANALGEMNAKIIMWDVLSADFDVLASKEECLSNVLNNVTPGSVVVFHDSEKAFKNLEYILPLVLKTLQKQNYQFKKIVL